VVWGRTASGAVAGAGALVAEEAGDGAGGLEGEVGGAVLLVKGGGVIRVGAEVGDEAAEEDAGADDFLFEGELLAGVDEVGEFLGEDGGVVAVGAAVLVAWWGAGAPSTLLRAGSISAGVGGAEGGIGAADGPGLAGVAGGGGGGAGLLGGHGQRGPRARGRDVQRGGTVGTDEPGTGEGVQTC
jgi:hypothetical protein